MAMSDRSWLGEGAPAGTIEAIGLVRYPDVRFERWYGSPYDARIYDRLRIRGHSILDYEPPTIVLPIPTCPAPIGAPGMTIYRGGWDRTPVCGVPPILVVPVNEAYGLSATPYQPDGRTLQAALFALARLSDRRGQVLRAGVRQFVQRFGLLPNTTVFSASGFWDAPEAWIPDFARQSIGMGNESGVPLFVYAHEARNLSATLDLYIALRDDDRSAVRHWIMAHHPSLFVYRFYEKTHPVRLDDAAISKRWEWLYRTWKANKTVWADKWSRAGWEELAERIRLYAQLFVDLDVRPAWPDGEDVITPTTRSGMFDTPLRYHVLAKSLIGAIYAELMQLVIEQRAVRPCAGCGYLFVPERANQTYCSKRCGGATRVRRLRARRRAEDLQTRPDA